MAPLPKLRIKEPLELISVPKKITHINSRPLIYQTPYLNKDLLITPNHFINGRIGREFKLGSVDEEKF